MTDIAYFIFVVNCKIAPSIISTSFDYISVFLKERLTRRRGELALEDIFWKATRPTTYILTLFRSTWLMSLRF